MTPQDLKDVEARFLKAAEKLPPPFKGNYEPLASMSEERYHSLQKRGIMFKKDEPRFVDAGILDHLPTGAGLYLSEDEKFMVWLG